MENLYERKQKTTDLRNLNRVPECQPTFDPWRLRGSQRT